MKKIQRVGLDLDGTVANYMAGAIPLLKEHYGLEPNYDVPAYRIEEVFGLTKETRPPNMRERLYEDLHLFRTLPKLEEDNHLLTHQLKHRRCKVYVITARSKSPVIVEDTIAWLTNNGFVFDDIFFTDHKADLCKLMGVDVMVEDEVGQIMDLGRERINTVIPDQPWNHDLPQINDVDEIDDFRTRAHNWREALAAIEEFLT